MRFLELIVEAKSKRSAWRVCASALSRQSLRHTDNQSLEVNEGLSDVTSNYVCVHVKKHGTTHMPSPASILSRATLGPPVKRHLDGVSLMGRYWSVSIAYAYWVFAKSHEQTQTDFIFTSGAKTAPVRTMTGTTTPGTPPNISSVAIIIIYAEFVVQRETALAHDIFWVPVVVIINWSPTRSTRCGGCRSVSCMSRSAI